MEEWGPAPIFPLPRVLLRLRRADAPRPARSPSQRGDSPLHPLQRMRQRRDGPDRCGHPAPAPPLPRGCWRAAPPPPRGDAGALLRRHRVGEKSWLRCRCDRPSPPSLGHGRHPRRCTGPVTARLGTGSILPRGRRLLPCLPPSRGPTTPPSDGRLHCPCRSSMPYVCGEDEGKKGMAQ